MPVMELDPDAGVLRDWARAVDDGPFSSLCRRERIAVMKRVWAREKVTESVLPVGPAPAHPGGPPPGTPAPQAAYELDPGRVRPRDGAEYQLRRREDALVTVLRGFQAVCSDEIQLIVTSSDVGQVRRVAEIVESIDV